MLLNRSVPDVKAKRTQWVESGLSEVANHLVFLDESAINVDLTRRYGRSIGQKRVVDHVPFNKPKCLTILSSIRLDGRMAYTTYTGGTTSERFVEYLNEVLIPTLEPGDIVVMDNVSSHRVEAVREALRKAGIILMYLPPYSPDMNPIEMLW